jgi:hypothetical protein
LLEQLCSVCRSKSVHWKFGPPAMCWNDRGLNCSKRFCYRHQPTYASGVIGDYCHWCGGQKEFCLHRRHAYPMTVDHPELWQWIFTLTIACPLCGQLCRGTPKKAVYMVRSTTDVCLHPARRQGCMIPEI